MAIGGDWGGQQGVDWSMFPVTFAVDYVRVYRSAGLNPTFIPNASDTTNVFPNATEFAVARCDATEQLSATGGWQNATLDRLANQRFNAMLRNASIPMVGTTACGGSTHTSNLLFASSLLSINVPATGPNPTTGYVFVNPGGGQYNDLQLAPNPTGPTGSKRLQTGSGYVPYVSAELQMYNQGVQASPPAAVWCTDCRRRRSQRFLPQPPPQRLPPVSTTPAPQDGGSTASGWNALSLGAKSGIIVWCRDWSDYHHCDCDETIVWYQDAECRPRVSYECRVKRRC